MPSLEQIGSPIFAIIIALVSVAIIIAWLLLPLLILFGIARLRRDANLHLTALERAAESNGLLLAEIAKASHAIDRCSNELLDAIETTHELDAQIHELDAKAYQRLKNLEELTAHTHRLLEWLGKQPQFTHSDEVENETETPA